VPRPIANRAVASDTVVLEMVERSPVSGSPALLASDNVAVIVKALQDNPRR
jgi:hypothetical protein